MSRRRRAQTFTYSNNCDISHHQHRAAYRKMLGMQQQCLRNIFAGQYTSNIGSVPRMFDHQSSSVAQRVAWGQSEVQPQVERSITMSRFHFKIKKQFSILHEVWKVLMYYFKQGEVVVYNIFYYNSNYNFNRVTNRKGFYKVIPWLKMM